MYAAGIIPGDYRNGLNLSFSFTARSFRKHDCMSRESDDVGFCCLAHFLTSSKLTVMLAQGRSASQNVFALGERAQLYLRKVYPCVDYLGQEDFDFLKGIEEDYSRVVPESGTIQYLDREDFDEKYANATVLPLGLHERDDLSNLRPVIDRNLKKHGFRACWESATDSDSDDESLSETEDLLPDEIEVNNMWVYCVDREWRKVSTVNTFVPDQRYKIIRLEDGNLIRAKWSECIEFLCERSSTCKPEWTPPESSLELIRDVQIYIYRCIDGYFEFTYSEGTHRNLFPFKNSDLARGTILRVPDFPSLRSGIAQTVSAGQLNMPSDAEAGCKMLQRIFDIDSDSCSDSENESSSINQIPRPTAPTVSRNIGSLEPSSRNRCMIPDKNGMCYSGVSGVYWDRTHRRWVIKLKNGSSSTRKKISTKSLDPKDIETACDAAIILLNDFDKLNGIVRNSRTFNMTPNEQGMCYSGVTGVSWHKRDIAWQIKYHGQHLGFEKAKSKEPRDIEAACKRAITLLNTYKNDLSREKG